MGWVAALGLLLGTLCVLLLLGLPVAFSFLAVNFVGAGIFMNGEAGIVQAIRNSMQSLLSFTLVPIPAFILMGELMLHSGLAFRAIGAIDRLIARVPGRMPVVTVVAGTAFAALSGSSMANAAMLGSTLLPEMLKRGYHPSIAMGPILAVGGVAILIPPSALAVLLGSLSGISISALLIGGIIPGLLMSMLFIGYIVPLCIIRPDLSPPVDREQVESGWARFLPFVRDVVPLFMIFGAVVGSMLGGLAAPSESAALGVVATLIAMVVYGKFSLKAVLTSVNGTGKITGMIFFIVASSLTFSQLLAFSGAASGMLGWLQSFQLSPLELIFMVCVVLLILGCFVDQVSMVMITIPFFIPMAKLAQVDMVWLGVLYLITMEISLLTPPFGILLFVMKSVAPSHITINQVIKAALPFVVLELIVLLLIIAFPVLATWLPAVLLGRG